MNSLPNEGSLLQGNDLRHLSIQRAGIFAVVCAAVAVRTNASHLPGVVRSAVAYSANVVRLKIGLSRCTGKRSRKAAAFADAICPGQHIRAHGCASLIDVPFRFASFRRRPRCLEGSLSESLEALIDFLRGRRAIGRKFAVRRYQCEHYRIAMVAVPIRLSFELPTGVVEHADKPRGSSALRFVEEQDVFAIGGVIPDRLVAFVHELIADLSLARVDQRAVGLPSVVVPRLRSPVTRDDEDDGMALRSRDATLLLAAVHPVDVSFAAVQFVGNEGPGHQPDMSGQIQEEQAFSLLGPGARRLSPAPLSNAHRSKEAMAA